MLCKKCGHKTIEGANFCQKCGTVLHIEKVEHNVERTAKYDIVLTDLGKDKALAVTVIAEHAGIELKEAKALANNLPRAIKIKKAATEAEAKAIQVAFAEIGARVILKYCKCCGEALTADGNRCGTCGSAATIITPDTTFHLEEYLGVKRASGVVGPQKNGSVYCPKCKSQKLQTIVESNVEGKGGGYGTGKGCLGWLLLGPLGLLCGMCGSGTKIKTTNATFFMCMDCGDKFREAKELIEEKSQTSIKFFIGGPIAIIIGVMMLFGGMVFEGLVVLVFGCLAIWFAFDEQKASKDIQSRKYEAECYKKKKK